MAQDAFHLSKRFSFLNTSLAILSGILLGCAFPSVDAKWLVWIGLAPLVVAIVRSNRPRDALILGVLTGFIGALIVLRPLVSAYAWSGWSTETEASFAARVARQSLFMHGVWVLFSLVGGGVFLGIWAVMMKRFAGTPLRLLVLGPVLWVVGPEWARAQVTFGFSWAFLGNACVDLPAIRQLAALGGVWLLSALVVLFNVGLAVAFVKRKEGWRAWLVPLIVVVGCVAIVWGSGRFRLSRGLSESEFVRVAALQNSKAKYTPADFDKLNLDYMYASMIEEAALRKNKIIVVPEAVVIGAISLDGTLAPGKPKNWQFPRDAWEEHVSWLLEDRDTLIMMGLYTVENSQAHNSFVGFTIDGAIDWYHKRRLVPYAEYRPAGWGWAIHGADQYVPGKGSQLMKWQGHQIGSFICQEVLIPFLAQESVRDGAELLVSGGNDGMFANPGAAETHADAAQLRAVENGRYLIRTMKTGVSAIIDPFGKELVRSEVDQDALLMAKVSFQEGLTPYARFGDWFLWLSGILSVVLSLTCFLPNQKCQALFPSQKVSDTDW